jgi:general secretion pathway protein H
MPARRPQRKPARYRRGFTLIELLVVLLLVGVLASFAVLSLGGQGPQAALSDEARRVQVRMDLAREEAILRAQSLGVRFTEDGYRFFERVDKRWRALEGDGVLAPRELPEGMRIQVDIDGLDIALQAPSRGEGEAATAADDQPQGPQIFFLAGGEILPAFTIHLLAEESRVEYRIQPGDEQWLALSEHRY